jgi:hypothetical protein
MYGINFGFVHSHLQNERNREIQQAERLYLACGGMTGSPRMRKREQTSGYAANSK